MIWKNSRFEDTIDHDHVVDEFSVCEDGPVKLMVSRTTTNNIPGPVKVQVWGFSSTNRHATASSMEEGRKLAVRLATVWLSETITYFHDTAIMVVNE